MCIERERSYMLTPESVPHILGFLGARTVGFVTNIRDDYLNPNLRVRYISQDHGDDELKVLTQQIGLTRKSGEKSSGQRNENNRNIDPETAAILTTDSKLQIIKKRQHIHTEGYDCIVTLDVIEAPMKMAVLEIESTDGKEPPTIKDIFGVELQECPLAAWDFFKQKIGICGAPSSGKTETAKAISHLLNTQFEANSFHTLEYATSFIQKYDRHPDAFDQFMIWYAQKAREDVAANRANIVISDCPTFLAYIYMLYHNRKRLDSRLRPQVAKLYKRVLEDIDTYSRIVFLNTGTVANNNIRFHSPGEVADIDERIRSFLRNHSVPHIIADRDQSETILKQLFYMNELRR